MGQIILEVDDYVAEFWNKLPAEAKQKISDVVNKQFLAIIDPTDEKEITLFLKNLRQELLEKGLTQEILEDILKHDD